MQKFKKTQEERLFLYVFFLNRCEWEMIDQIFSNHLKFRLIYNLIVKPNCDQVPITANAY